MRDAKQEVPKRDLPLWQCAVPRSTRAPRAWAEWEITLWSKILSIHGVGKARNTRRSEKIDHFHATSEARASCELAS